MRFQNTVIGITDVRRARMSRAYVEFYAIGRLLLLLIQSFASAALRKQSSLIEWGHDDDDEPIMSDPKQVLISLHLV